MRAPLPTEITQLVNPKKDADESEDSHGNDPPGSVVPLQMHKETIPRSEEEKRKDKDAPNDFLCPITLMVMQDPVVASDGFSYEKTAIEDWIRLCEAKDQVPKSPKTNAAIMRMTMPNHTLKSRISDWREKHKSICIPQARRKSRKSRDDLLQDTTLKARTLLDAYPIDQAVRLEVFGAGVEEANGVYDLYFNKRKRPMWKQKGNRWHLQSVGKPSGIHFSLRPTTQGRKGSYSCVGLTPNFPPRSGWVCNKLRGPAPTIILKDHTQTSTVQDQSVTVLTDNRDLGTQEALTSIKSGGRETDAQSKTIHFDGVWLTSSGNSQTVSNGACGTSPFEELMPGQCRMCVSETWYEGTTDGIRIRWSDGDVWTRVESCGDDGTGSPMAETKTDTLEEEGNKTFSGLTLYSPPLQSAELVQRPRHALVIGNVLYPNFPEKEYRDSLRGVDKGVDRLCDVLSMKAGFNRIDGSSIKALRNLHLEKFNDEIIRFLQGIQKNDDVLFYFCGHCCNFRGDTYLVPTDAPSRITPGNIKDCCIKLNDLKQIMAEKVPRLKMICIDACAVNVSGERTNVRIDTLMERHAVRNQRAQLHLMRPTAINWYILAAPAADTISWETAADGGRFTNAFCEAIQMPGAPLGKLRSIIQDVVMQRERVLHNKQKIQISVLINSLTRTLEQSWTFVKKRVS